ncbi:unnamed protein product [Oikopleura dioica]|uniref:Uncharacterized protein n=1 Tax=Oikopleura dioica TaxID=34765 RepID=E4XC53_OIKDI|nr:unnamed protein product [Oikopleura dioica]
MAHPITKCVPDCALERNRNTNNSIMPVFFRHKLKRRAILVKC